YLAGHGPPRRWSAIPFTKATAPRRLHIATRSRARQVSSNFCGSRQRGLSRPEENARVKIRNGFIRHGSEASAGSPPALRVVVVLRDREHSDLRPGTKCHFKKH